MHALAVLIQDALSGLRSQGSTLVLVVISIVVGAASLTALIGVVHGLKSREMTLVQALGADTLHLKQTAFNDDSSQRLQWSHVAALRDFAPDINVTATRHHLVPTLGIEQHVSVVQTDQQWMAQRGLGLSTGRFIDSEDMRQRQRVAVVTRSLARDWRWPTGAFIELDGMPYQIVGELNSNIVGDYLGDWQSITSDEHAVFIPLSLPAHWIEKDEGIATPIDQLLIRTGDISNNTSVVRRIERFLEANGISGNTLSWVTPQSLTQGIKTLRKTVTLTLGSLACLLLVLASITLATVMMTNVRARHAEIGLRRSLGATRNSIRMQFMLEGLVVALVGSIIGVVIAVPACQLLAIRVSLPVLVDALMICTPIFLCGLIGALASYWPASQAAAVQPAVALRA